MALGNQPLLTGFRLISVLEGLSFLILLGAAYVFNYREYMFYIGMTHGLLFLAYFFVSLSVSHKQGWSVFYWLFVSACSVIPFAFIPLEFKLKQRAI
ncbi:hypothetical protein A9Q99_09740 [Gammaproteobacteria bacterium 45_16_T64]|nr:hypothetical protein A9Q99_09740 [Gammaproteobacteria bacterium 45_16_T64]